MDLSIYQIQGGFRGFAQVPSGAHYIAVKDYDNSYKSFWCYLKPSSVIVKILDYEKKEFTDDSQNNEARFTTMALSGVMNHVLIPVIDRNAEMATLWIKLTTHINKSNFPPVLNYEIPMETPLHLSAEELSNWYLHKFKSRFEQAFYDTHNGDPNSFLAEFQYAFIKWIVSKTDEIALERWTPLIQAIYNAGERCIEDNHELFPPLIDTLINQFKCLPDDMFKTNSKITYKAEDLIEDMIDTGNETLKEKADEFSNYLKLRIS